MTGKEVLRAIADGADPSEFECRYKEQEWKQFQSDDWAVCDMLNSQYHTFRRKPRTRVVNGFTVPAPLDSLPEGEDALVYCAMPDLHNFHAYQRVEKDLFNRENLIKRGLLFSTKEAAIANAKAMVGIDPESKE